MKISNFIGRHSKLVHAIIYSTKIHNLHLNSIKNLLFASNHLQNTTLYPSPKDFISPTCTTEASVASLSHHRRSAFSPRTSLPACGLCCTVSPSLAVPLPWWTRRKQTGRPSRKDRGTRVFGNSRRGPHQSSAVGIGRDAKARCATCRSMIARERERKRVQLAEVRCSLPTGPRRFSNLGFRGCSV